MRTIKWVLEDGSFIITNGLPFDYLVSKAAYDISYKTWKMFPGWHLHFHEDAATREVIYSLEDERAEKWKKLMFQNVVGNWYYDGHGPVSGIAEYYIGDKLIAVELGGAFGGGIPHFIVEPEFEIYEDGELIFKRSAPGYKEWEIIHELSGNKDGRQFKIMVSNEFGEMAGSLVSSRVELGSLYALRKDSFEKTERGNYIVREFGKFKFSDVNVPGYYMVKKECEKCEILELYKPYEVVKTS